MVRVESAGVGEDPKSGLADSLELRPDCRPGPSECAPIGTDPQNGHPGGSVKAQLTLETVTAVHELTVGELGRVGRRSRNDICEATPHLEQLRVLRREVDARGKPGRVQSRPKTVSGSGEMMTHCSRIESRIDAAEEHLESRSDDVGQAPVPAGMDLSRGRASIWHGYGQRRRAV